jgi:acyl dehydratase
MDVRLLKPVFPGDELRIGARLAEKRKEKSDYFISFEVWIKNQRNEDVVVGHASVTY